MDTNVRNVEDVLSANKSRFVSQTTGYICAKCGETTKLTNREKLPITVENLENGLCRIYFPCPKCDETYDLGFAVLS